MSASPEALLPVCGNTTEGAGEAADCALATEGPPATVRVAEDGLLTSA